MVILGHFLPFYPLRPQKSRFLKMEKFAGDIIILHMYTKNHNHMMYGSWHMDCYRQNFLSLWTIFYPFTPPYGPRKSKFWKTEKILEDIIILQIFTINDSHMIYGFSDIECNRIFFFCLSFWTVFCPFTPLTIQKIKILKKWKKPLEILSFYTSVPKIMIICYTVP